MKEKDIHVFPENNWHLEINDYNRDIVNNWRINIMKFSNEPCGYQYINYNGAGVGEGWSCRLEALITTDQFKEYVLNIQPITNQYALFENLDYLIDLFKKLNIK